MLSESEKVKDATPAECWKVAERIILLLTFVWMSVGTCYSVRVASTALSQAELSMRPWLAIKNVNTHVEAMNFSTAFELVNIGQLPAHVQVSVVADMDGKTIPPEAPGDKSPTFVVLPGETILRDALRVSGQLFQEMREGQGEHRVSQRVHVRYGTKKGDLRYETVKGVELTSASFKELIVSPNRSGCWKLVEADFK